MYGGKSSRTPGAGRAERVSAVWAICLLVCGGCVERRMTIRTDPPGALAIVDNQELGFTPVSTSFVYYGTREVKLIKDGYETLTVMEPIPPPWYQYPVVEFFADTLVPWRIHDDRELSYRMEPAKLQPTNQLLQRAEDMRGRGHSPLPGADQSLLPSGF